MIGFTHARRSLLLASSLLLPGVAHAGQDVNLNAIASADVGYSSNQFMRTGSNTAAGYAQIQASPQVTIATEHDVFALTGMARYQRYFERYGDNYAYNAGLDYKGTPSARVKTHLNANYDNAVIGQNYFDLNNAGSTVPNGSDLALFGTNNRRQTVKGSGDISIALSAHDTLTAGGYYLRTRYNQQSATGDYDGYGGNLGYSRQISARLQMGVQGSVAHYAYRFLPAADTTVYAPQLTFSNALTAYWKVTGAAGASFIEKGTGSRSVSFAGNLDLCRTTDRATFCLSGRRAVLPTGINGSQNTILGGLQYSYKLTSRSSLSVNGDYMRNSGIKSSNVAATSYLRSSAQYRYALSERIDATVTARYAKMLEDPLGRSADYGGLVGLSVKLGNTHGG